MTLTKRKTVHRVSAHDRKRIGQHHTQNHHYIKSYWPYLPVLAVLGLGLVFNTLIGRQNHVLGYATGISSSALLAQSNGERTSQNESALQLNAELTAAAQAKADDMAARDYWSHVSPDGKQPWNFIQKTGYQYQAAGENLAYGFGTSDQVITAWMHSAEHRANLLNPNYQDVGFATANVADYQGAGRQTVVVAMYGEPVGMINSGSSTPPAVLGSGTHQISRLQLLTTSSWVQMSVAAIAGAALMLFFVRHAFAWHKVLVRGEQFLLHHPFFDVFLISAAVLMFLLSHAAGTIL